MEIGIAYVCGDGPFLAPDGYSNGRLDFLFEVSHLQVPIQHRQFDYGTQIPCLLRHQEQPAVEPDRQLVENSLYGSLEQQGIQGLLEILEAVPDLERDAVMDELRSMYKIQTDPLLDSAGGPAGPQQSSPLMGKACQASPHM